MRLAKPLECWYSALKNGEINRLQVLFYEILSQGLAKFLTFAPIIIKGSLTFYAKQKVSSDKSNASDLRLSAGGS